MRQALKRMAEHILPARLFTEIVSIRSRNYQQHFLRDQGLLELAERMISRYGSSVLHGPFKGMIYPQEAILSRHLTPKLLGTYEMELHPVLAKVIAHADSYDHFIDIGCAEGYYAIGLAKETGKLVYAFDTEPRERAFCCLMAQLNGVADKVVVKSWCDSNYLQKQKGRRCFIMSDCEGYEVKLFADESIQALSRCDLLIELHDEQHDASREICRRFRGSHFIEMLFSSGRDPEQHEELSFLGKDAYRAICEYRKHGQQWGYLRSKAESSEWRARVESRLEDRGTW